MATITLKNIPDDLYKKIKDKAQQHRRSINNEIIFCLEQTLKAQPVAADALLQKARAVREKMGVYLSEDELKAQKGSGRP
jgi:antitoxin FitA